MSLSSLSAIVKDVLGKEPKINRKLVSYYFNRPRKHKHLHENDRFLEMLYIVKPLTVSVLTNGLKEEEKKSYLETITLGVKLVSPETVITIKDTSELQYNVFPTPEQQTMIKEFRDADLLIELIPTNDLSNIVVKIPSQFAHIRYTDFSWGKTQNLTEEDKLELLSEALDMIKSRYKVVEDMFLMDEVITHKHGSNQRILITCFNDRRFTETQAKLTELLGSIPKCSKWTQIDIRFVHNEYQKESDWQETISNVAHKPYSFILALSDEIEVYSQDRDGIVSDKLGWLLI